MSADEIETTALIGAELSTLQQYIVSVVVVMSSCLSAFSSIRILLLQRNAKDGRQTYHRLIFSMSVADVFFSLCCLLQLLLVNKENTVMPLAIGNQTSCDLIGFSFTFFYFVVVIHNALLSLHFWLIVVRRWTHPDMKKYFHRQSAVVAWVLPLIIQLYTVLSSRYVQTSVAMICFSDREHIAEKIEVAWLGIAALIATTFTVWVYIFYKKRIKTNMRHSSYASSFATEAQIKRSKKLARRSVSYFLVYLNTIFWAAVLNVVADIEGIDLGGGWVFALRLISWIFLPLQGFFNMMVYVQPMVSQKHQDYPEFSEWKIFLLFFIFGKFPEDGNGTGRFSLSMRGSGAQHVRQQQSRQSYDTNEDEEKEHSNDTSDLSTNSNFLRVGPDGSLSGSMGLQKPKNLVEGEEENSNSGDEESQRVASRALVPEEDADVTRSSSGAGGSKEAIDESV